MATVDGENLRWHYTTGNDFKKIVESGEIQPSRGRVPPSERPAVWFSTEPIWEPTATKAWINPDGTKVLSMAINAEKGGGLFRIGVLSETAPHDWHAFKQLSGITSKMAKGLYNVAKEQNARPGRWYVTFEVVPKSAWVSVETWDGINPAGWMPLETGKDG